MPHVTVFEGRVQRLEILDPQGNADAALMPDLTDEQLTGLLVSMIRMRVFDDKALALQRQGRMGTYGSLRGQEAAQAGLALALEPSDWLVPSIREQGVLEARGLPMHLYYAFCKGDERASLFPDSLRALPQSIPVASQLLHAAGIGMGLRLKGERAAAVGFAGDGATSEGDFHEALNFAGVFRAQTVFYIQNNGWAISVPLERQTAARTLAQKALAYGIPGVQVDGNDALAVYAASRDALARARAGEGPTLLEAVTFRMESHTTADDNRRYCPPELIEQWAARDPIDRMRRFLTARGLWDPAREEALMAELAELAEAEVARLEARTPPEPTDLFDFMYARLTPALAAQRRELTEELGS